MSIEDLVGSNESLQLLEMAKKECHRMVRQEKIKLLDKLLKEKKNYGLTLDHAHGIDTEFAVPVNAIKKAKEELLK